MSARVPVIVVAVPAFTTPDVLPFTVFSEEAASKTSSSVTACVPRPEISPAPTESTVSTSLARPVMVATEVASTVPVVRALTVTKSAASTTTSLSVTFWSVKLDTFPPRPV